MKKIKFFLFGVFVLLTLPVSAQMATSDLTTQGLISSHIFMNAKIASEEAVRSNAQYLEVIARFAEIIKTVNFVSSTIKNVYDMGKTLATTSPKVWLDDALAGVESSLPIVAEIRSDIDDIIGKGKALSKGKYFDYVSRWDSKSLSFYNKLALNYEKHAMFPELYPKSSKARGWEKQTDSVIVKKAWVESGMANEMDDDMVRKRLFGQYYEEYLKQAKKSDNIEAVGTAKQLQASYLINENLDHIKKNSDMEVIQKMSDHEKVKKFHESQEEYNKAAKKQEEKLLDK